MCFRKEKVPLVGNHVSSGECEAQPGRCSVFFVVAEWGNRPRDCCPQTVHIFGAKSSPMCANFSLKQMAAEFEHLFEPNMSEIVNSHFYVDNFMSLPSVAEAVTA